MIRSLLAGLLALALSACGPMLSALGSMAGPPPQAPAAVTNVSRTALDFALNAFDAVLYGLDWAMDAGRIQPGSPQARNIAAIGRRVMAALGAAEAARDIGNSATYEEAFSRARSALEEFRTAAGMQPQASALFEVRRLATVAAYIGSGHIEPLTAGDRRRILTRLETPPSI